MTKTKAELEKELINAKESFAACLAKNKELRCRMEQQTSTDTYYKAVLCYGKEPQLIMAMEEMAELTKELSKNIRGSNNTSAVSEEIADVEIMLEQLKIIFNNRAEVDCVRAYKLARLSDRIARRE